MLLTSIYVMLGLALALGALLGIAANGLVKVQMTCKNEVKRVTLDDSVMDDKETLEDLLVIALKDATAKAEATASSRLSSFMPAGMKLPF